MFSDEEKEEVENFMSYLDDFEEDRIKRLESIKRVDKLLGNSNSFEESTQWKVEGKDEV